MKPRDDVAALLRAGATYATIHQQLGVTNDAISATRKAHQIPVLPGKRRRRWIPPEQRQALRSRIAEMLRNGATYAEIYTELEVSHRLISETRKTHDIPVPKGRRLNPAQRAAIWPRVAELLRAGTPWRQIAAETGLSSPSINHIRKHYGIQRSERRTPGRRPRTTQETLALFSQPYGDGHARWTGPWRGRSAQLWANGSCYNARHEAFRAHHGRAPEGLVKATCEEPQCLAGAHLADRPMREHLDGLYDAIFRRTS